jgi:hypothetical protein
MAFWRPKWLAPAAVSVGGTHTFGPRKTAVVFQTRTEAEAAAKKATESFRNLGMVFAVEPAD